LPEALAMARERDLDLVEVAPQAAPPVCRIMDYGKFRYEESQKLKESRKKATHISIKEVKFRPKIGKGDFDTKVRHMFDFLNEGHKVKVTLQFRGREMAHPELGSKILDQVLTQIGPLGKVEASARLEGRNMTMVLSPDKKAAELAAKKAADEAAEAADAEQARAEAAAALDASEAAVAAAEPAPATVTADPVATEPAATSDAADESPTDQA
jgi:translation initiation factor IF-3